ncbi:fatty acid cis/trans isomerase [Colwellia psychrerythraea]|uniref:Fatty acid cistrans isomerase n=1 Tax=Colwellia psychrerythraea TaxID=28229 RepID=A0A099L5G9_COLPS|nr:fatty acid cis/trans isomerase [Colwellia psychrerythraea]KGJ97660.1 fatty acid cistrans isomerase [Colwellia psychrerythraea]
MRKFQWLFIFLFLSGCATLGVMEFDKLYGPSHVDNRLSQPKATAAQEIHFNQQIQPIIENRCVVCHGCYDAPCQLKMESRAGIERGANKAIVYSGERLLTAKISDSLSKLTELNSQSLAPLRQQGFFPVLNERQQTEQVNTQASLIYQMLLLKKQHPLPNEALLNKSFDISLDRSQQCPTIEEFEQYKSNFPLGGMPYALPGLTNIEHNKLTAWLTQGAIMPATTPLTSAEQKMINRWEILLNGSSAKEQLIARYLYEHLYLANLYFDKAQTSYFKLVRSSTASGEKIAVITTRRPFDSPYADGRNDAVIDKPDVFYRLIKHNDTIIAKRHMPYPFGEEKFARLNALFYQPDYTVNSLPDYQLANASNPFKTFQAIPNKSRYQFLLDQAQFSIMNFIKGPVCRGQIALNVIEDNFWVFFLNPDSFDNYPNDEFINANTDLLQLPAATSDNAMSLLYWRQYANRQQQYVKNKLAYIEELNLQSDEINLDLIWSGKGNPNASLTVFRHYDSASVLKGFVGPTPKTAWLITYPLLERIHYLLVAGFDVYGNVGHQLKTRLYMDFLRMEAESNFISLLPKKQRKSVHEHWYRDTDDTVKDYIFSDDFYQLPDTGLNYQTSTPKKELFQFIANYTKNSQVNQFNLTSLPLSASDKLIADIENMPGESVALLPQVSYVMVENNGKQQVYSLINNSAHTNVAHLFSEENRRLPAEDNLAVLRGVVGTYPNAFFKIDQVHLVEFVNSLVALKTEQDYQTLKDQFSIRRTNSDFWIFADELHAWYKTNQPDSAGLLDFNRLENR